MRILIVEDEVPVARQIAAALTEDGHDPKVVHSGEAALDEMSKKPFDLFVLDVRLPGIDGFELLRRLRTQHLASRVLLLTARSAVDDRVSGLQLGADDYLPKPFAMRELVARVRALGRRYSEEPVMSLRVGDEVNHLRYEEGGLGVVTEVMTSSIPGGTCLARVRFQDGQLRCFNNDLDNDACCYYFGVRRYWNPTHGVDAIRAKLFLRG